MALISEEFLLDGKYAYGGRNARRLGYMKGMGVRYNDNKIVGVITDKDMLRDDFRKGFSRYFVGAFHNGGLSLIKFDSFDSMAAPIHWMFERQGDGYVGGWCVMRVSPLTILLKSIPYLQAAADLDISGMIPLFEMDFAPLLGYARRAGQTGSITLAPARPGQVREDLRL